MKRIYHEGEWDEQTFTSILNEDGGYILIVEAYDEFAFICKNYPEDPLLKSSDEELFEAVCALPCDAWHYCDVPSEDDYDEDYFFYMEQEQELHDIEEIEED